MRVASVQGGRLALRTRQLTPFPHHATPHVSVTLIWHTSLLQWHEQ